MILRYSKKSLVDLTQKVEIKLKDSLDKTLELEFFLEELERHAREDTPGFHGTNKLYLKEYPRVIRVAPSINEIYNIVLSLKNDLDDINNSGLPSNEIIEARKSLLKEKIKPKYEFALDSPPEIWWGDTLGGLNCRIGFVENDRSKPFPFSIGGTKSHVCAGGNTGEGKSVMMDALLTSWLTEYPPWELRLFLVDMKMLEHAKYAQGYKCPHIQDIGITGSTTYIVSVLEFVEKEMTQMYTLTSLCGVNSLKGLRNLLDMAIPRTVVLMDEYAQLRANGSARENLRADNALQSIALKGRAMCYHLLPTTQNFAGNIESKTLGQFKVGMCVGANNDNSENIIGNEEAIYLKKKRGYAIVNENRTLKDISENKEYKVAFLDMDSEKGMSSFQSLLKRICYTGETMGIVDEPTVYNEKFQRSYTSVTYDLIELYKGLEFKQKNFGAILLGDETVYRQKGEGSSSAYIMLNYERNNNIYINAMNPDDMMYILKLVGLSLDFLKEMQIEFKITVVLDDSQYYLKTYFSDYREDLTGMFELGRILNIVNERDLFLKYNLYAMAMEESISFVEYMRFVYRKTEDSGLSRLNFDKLSKLDLEDFEEIDRKEMTGNLEDLSDYMPEYIPDEASLASVVNRLSIYKQFSKHIQGEYIKPEDFPVQFFVFFEPQLNEGLTRRGSMSEPFINFLKKAPTVGMFCIILQREPRGFNDILKSCKFLLSGRPHSFLDTIGMVSFSDTSGIALKSTIIEGDGDSDAYFKKYYYRDDEFFTSQIIL